MTTATEQINAAEELLFAGPQRLGVGKGLFLGRYVADWVTPYPSLTPEAHEQLTGTLARLRRFLDEHLDPAAIDRQADIPRELIDGLAELGVLGLTVPPELGGLGYSQMEYCQVLEEIGSRCASTAVFVNAHHSIGLRALLLFGTDEQRNHWLPPLSQGAKLAAFALTEPEAGSDASNVQTQAVPNSDGSVYVLNGEKRYITNAAIADVLTVLARTPVPGKKITQITAFLVTPDLPGFVVTEPRMEKLGIRGTATGQLEFHDMPVPAANILGPLGGGLKVALTVLDFGRTTFGASCTGAAKTCLQLAVKHAVTRRQFFQPLGDFELVKKKIASMAASIYAMEAMSTVTASLIDRHLEDYMLETAMLKVFATEALWQIVNDTFQIHGGAAYFTDRPLERMLRDARINQIAEGANDVLMAFIALVGMRGPGVQLQELWEAVHHPATQVRTMWQLGVERVGAAVRAPVVPVQSPELRPHAQRLSRLIWRFNLEVDRALIHYREDILERQYLQERVARAAMDLYASACVLSRWDSDLQVMKPNQGAPDLFLRGAARRVAQWLAELHDNDDAAITKVADAVMRR